MAALFDLSHEEVRLAPINDPAGVDVSLSDEGRLLLVAEVKQKAADESMALHVAERASALGADKGLLVALAADQRSIDRERVRRQAAERYGISLTVWEGVEELVSEVAVQAPLTAAEIAAELPAAYLRRMHEHEVSLEGQAYWADLVAGLGAREQDG